MDQKLLEEFVVTTKIEIYNPMYSIKDYYDFLDLFNSIHALEMKLTCLGVFKN